LGIRQFLFSSEIVFLFREIRTRKKRRKRRKKRRSEDPKFEEQKTKNKKISVSGFLSFLTR
jgi:hypothetical protein